MKTRILPCIVADGQYRMASSNNVFSLYGKTDVTTSATGVDICTVYSSRGIQPVLTLPDDCNWLTNLSAQALGSNKYKITGILPRSTNDAVATTLTMTCDNLSPAGSCQLESHHIGSERYRFVCPSIWSVQPIVTGRYGC